MDVSSTGQNTPGRKRQQHSCVIVRETKARREDCGSQQAAPQDPSPSLAFGISLETHPLPSHGPPRSLLLPSPHTPAHPFTRSHMLTHTLTHRRPHTPTRACDTAFTLARHSHMQTLAEAQSCTRIHTRTLRAEAAGGPMSRPQRGTPPSRWPLLAASSVWYKALEGGIGKTSPFPLLFLSLSLLIWQSLLKVGHWVLATQSCPALPPVDCSPPGPSVHGILQTRILEWVALSSSRGFSGPRDRTWITRMQADSALSEPPLGECSSCHKD